MSYLRYVCLFAYNGVQQYYVVFLFCFSASFSGFSIFYYPFSIL
jgi:hypothetical protein